MSTVKLFSIWFRIRKIFQALITIRWHEQTVNTEFIEDFLYGSKIIKMFQTLIGILNHEHTVNIKEIYNWVTYSEFITFQVLMTL